MNLLTPKASKMYSVVIILQIIESIRKGRYETYADVVSGGLDLSTREVDFEKQNNKVKFVKSDGRKEQIYLNAKVKKSFQNSYTTSESRLIRYFCLETNFNLSHCVLTDAEIQVL